MLVIDLALKYSFNGHLSYNTETLLHGVPPYDCYVKTLTTYSITVSPVYSKQLLCIGTLAFNRHAQCGQAELVYHSVGTPKRILGSLHTVYSMHLEFKIGFDLHISKSVFS